VSRGGWKRRRGGGGEGRTVSLRGTTAPLLGSPRTRSALAAAERMQWEEGERARVRAGIYI
jgi:hypothetical protein